MGVERLSTTIGEPAAAWVGLFSLEERAALSALRPERLQSVVELELRKAASLRNAYVGVDLGSGFEAKGGSSSCAVRDRATSLWDLRSSIAA